MPTIPSQLDLARIFFSVFVPELARLLLSERDAEEIANRIY
jgi:hypothetical protein